MGRSAGAGSPLTFQCWKCRRENWKVDVDIRFGIPGGRRRQRSGHINRVVLTGKTKKRGEHLHCMGIRHSHMLYQYECLDCGHVGYSSHYEVEKYGKKKENQDG